ncbi:hypothetical protein [Xanthomonas vesicatoria]|uniref:Membrane protein n=3 Tax=Xanthomonas vesicatoria TaxID=56460 RepID=A0AAJ0N3F2_9XANT|nr:hypothetical protein [Xanthomonas vesicatoria]APO95557.1 hypothetical protein BI313_13965 [Xanthomonas vesicatoria]EGD07688.1 hypothetical protein XVE_4110 [Xanthomonas vesicatoria ATCC 35937]KHM91428.1 membrane protein [Xanthomonas vesicatoria]KHM94824.1 membrane protein [Xanthomonas vesicatoria]KTF35243.1 membrane protein [Xanthomonas vesicatoria]
MTRCKRNALLLAGLGVVLIGSGLLGLVHWLPLTDYMAGLSIGIGLIYLALSLLMWISRSVMRDSARPALARRYHREFGVPMALYVGVMLVWRYLLAHVAADWTRVLIALLPALLVVLVIRAVARYVRDSDEMQRRIELEAIAIAAGLVSGGYMAAGFLQAARLIDLPASAAMLCVFPLLCAIYGITKGIHARRFA